MNSASSGPAGRPDGNRLGRGRHRRAAEDLALPVGLALDAFSISRIIFM
jgi:hypothetical protein